MREVDPFEASSRLEQLLDLVALGEEVVITRDGKAVARLIPPPPVVERDEGRAAIQRLRERAEAREFGRFDWAEWTAFREEGRP